MKPQPLPLIGGFYADDSARPWDMQDICNWLPTAAEVEGTRTPAKAETPPGLSPFVQGGTGKVRSVYSAENRLFTTIGSGFYQVSNSSVLIPRGTIPGVSRVKHAHNLITGGNQVLSVNGSAGFIYNTQDLTFTTITDAGYPGAIDCLEMDGYFVQIEPARRFAFHSDLADGLSYNTTDRFTSEASPDLLVGLGAAQNDLVLFSESSGEFFRNEGHAVQPFRSTKISMERGAASRSGQAHLDNTLFWLGNDGKFYVLDGYAAKRISNSPIEEAIRRLNWAQAFAFTWDGPGHSVVYWTFPDGQTWGYDVAQPPGLQWHRRESLGMSRWRVSGTAFWNRRWIAGDFQAGRLYELDRNYPLEYQDEFVSEVTGPVIHDHQSAVQMERLELLFDMGQPEVSAREFPVQPDPPTISPDPEGSPIGVVGESYNPPIGYQWVITPGSASVSGVTLREGELPDGLTMNAVTGDITGTPTEAGTFEVTVRATDANGLWDEAGELFAVVFSMFVAVDSALTLQKSSDGGDTFPDAVTSGLTTTTSEVYVQSVGGKLFHFGASNEGRVSSDGGATWSACTGLPADPGSGNVTQVGEEFQLYTVGGAMYVSSTGTAWALRAVESGTTDQVRCPAHHESTVLAICSGNRLNLSGDAGVTWAEYQDASYHGTSGVQRLWHTGTCFLAFGRDGSGNLAIRRSLTGASGSWTTITAPATAICHGVAQDATTGRVLIVLQTGATWYSDDDGESWEEGAAVPYGGALGFPPEQTNNLRFANDRFYFGAAQGGGVNTVYRSGTGADAWLSVYSRSDGNAINSLCEHVP